MAILTINPVKNEIIFPLFTIFFLVVTIIQTNYLYKSDIFKNNEDYLLANR